MKKGIHKKAMLVMFCLTILSGCWDRREIEERTNVVSFGVDAAKNEKMKVTMQIPIPRMIAGGQGGGGGGGGDPVKIVSATGQTFLDTMARLQHLVNQRIFYGHTRVIALGEAYARRGTEMLVDALRREPQVRRLLYPIVVKNGTARDLLEMKTELQQIPAVFIMSAIENEIDVGAMLDATLGHFYIALSKSAVEPVMTAVQMMKDGNMKVVGLAVFRNDRLVGFLNMKQTTVLLHIRGENDGYKSMFPIIGHPQAKVTFVPELKDTEYTFRRQNGKLHITVDVFLEGEVAEFVHEDQFVNKLRIDRVERSVERGYEKRARRLLKLLQNKYKSDVTRLGAYLRAFHYEIWKQLNWERDFQRADIRVRYHVSVRSSGMEKE